MNIPVERVWERDISEERYMIQERERQREEEIQRKL